MDVLPTFVVYNAGGLDEAGVAAAKSALEQRLARLFLDTPIPYRRQNDGDYPDGHELAANVAPDIYGIPAHIRSNPISSITVTADRGKN